MLQKNLLKCKALLKNVDGTFVTSKEVLDKYNESLGKVFGEAQALMGKQNKNL